MKITKFAKRVTRAEKGKKQIDIAQVMELLSKINNLTGGALYAIIKLMK